MEYNSAYSWSGTETTESPSNTKEYWSNNKPPVNYSFSFPWEVPLFRKEWLWMFLEDKVSDEWYTERAYHNKDEGWIPATKYIKKSSYAIGREHIRVSKSISE